ncbi:MAG: hypothetical protein WBL74_12260 [Novosphingobium sp.]|uniref:hypothetical protein n=1 Tax=Novosphingobium sp. TaxID=1874826 RepID=UPI003C7A98F5
MRALKIEKLTGDAQFAHSVEMVPQSVVLLAEVLAQSIGLSKQEMIRFGSPSWVISGVISDAIMHRIDRKADDRRRAGVRILADLASANAAMIPDATISGLPTSELAEIVGMGLKFDLDAEFPMTTRWKGVFFGGQEGTFAGISASRERRARNELAHYSQEYVINPWSSEIRFGNFAQEFVIDKADILHISVGEASSSQLGLIAKTKP